MRLPLLAGGITGAGVIVASSIPASAVSRISLDGSVIGCVDFVGDALGHQFGEYSTTLWPNDLRQRGVTFSTASAIRNAVLAGVQSCSIRDQCRDPQSERRRCQHLRIPCLRPRVGGA
jgi:hypothetical protein